MGPLQMVRHSTQIPWVTPTNLQRHLQTSRSKFTSSCICRRPISGQAVCPLTLRVDQKSQEMKSDGQELADKYSSLSLGGVILGCVP